MADADAGAALIRLAALPPSARGDRRIADALVALSREAPEEVLDSIASAFPAARAVAFRSAVLAAWAEREGEGAAAWARAHGAMGDLLHGLTDAGDYGTGLALAEAEPAAAVRRDGLAEVLLAWAKYDPASAGGALLALPATPDRDATIVGVLQRWLQDDAASAAQVANQLPAGALRERAFAQIASTWVPRDPAAAAAWAAQLPRGPDADSLAVALATEPDWLPDHLDWALAWSNRIVDGDARFNSLSVILRSLARENPAAAQAVATGDTALSGTQRATLAELLTHP